MTKRTDLTSRAWKAQRARVIERDGHACTACGTDHDLTVDHRDDPFARRRDRMSAEEGRQVTDAEVAATYTDDELVTLCRPCNSRKGDRLDVRIDYRAPGWFRDAATTDAPVF